MNIPICKIKNWNLDKKKVIVRIDANVSFVDGNIESDFKLQAIRPTIDYLLSKNAQIILLTHIGRPTDHEKSLSTKNLLPWFKKHNYPISFVQDFKEISKKNYPFPHIILVENLRFFKEETTQDLLFAKEIAYQGDFYVNDAFGCIHRNETSLTTVAQQFKQSSKSIGFLMEKELKTLSDIAKNPKRPFVAIIGGGKIKTKISTFESLLSVINTLLVCPALSFTFEAARRKNVGRSLIDTNMFSVCSEIVSYAKNNNKELILPIDYQVAQNNIDGQLSIKKISEFVDSDIGISIGPKTLDLFIQKIRSAQTIFFNGIMGFTSRPETLFSSTKLMQAIAQSDGYTIIAGGDSVSHVLSIMQAEHFSFLSTGGGSALYVLANKKCPALEALL